MKQEIKVSDLEDDRVYSGCLNGKTIYLRGLVFKYYYELFDSMGLDRTITVDPIPKIEEITMVWIDENVT